MATVTRQTTRQIVLHNVAWSTYEAILTDMEDRAIHLTYDQGDLEIMSPSDEHERIKTLIGRMIERLTDVMDIPIRSAGSTTFRIEMKRRGLEPDESYYVANEPRIRGRDTIDLQVDPPPDLAVEVDISRSSLDRMGIYASIGVPEVWRYETGQIVVHVLRADGSYERQDQSPSFPFLPLSEFSRFLARRNDSDETTWIRQFGRWAATLR